MQEFGLPQNEEEYLLSDLKTKLNFKFPVGCNKKTKVADILEKGSKVDKYVISRNYGKSSTTKRKK